MTNNRARAARIIERFLPPLPGSLGAMQAEKTAHALADAGLLLPDTTDDKVGPWEATDATD